MNFIKKYYAYMIAIAIGILLAGLMFLRCNGSKDKDANTCNIAKTELDSLGLMLLTDVYYLNNCSSLKARIKGIADCVQSKDSLPYQKMIKFYFDPSYEEEYISYLLLTGNSHSSTERLIANIKKIQSGCFEKDAEKKSSQFVLAYGYDGNSYIWYFLMVILSLITGLLSFIWYYLSADIVLVVSVATVVIVLYICYRYWKYYY